MKVERRKWRRRRSDLESGNHFLLMVSSFFWWLVKKLYIKHNIWNLWLWIAVKYLNAENGWLESTANVNRNQPDKFGDFCEWNPGRCIVWVQSSLTRKSPLKDSGINEFCYSQQVKLTWWDLRMMWWKINWHNTIAFIGNHWKSKHANWMSMVSHKYKYNSLWSFIFRHVIR